MLRTDGGDVQARTVLISSGVAYRKLGVPPLEELVGAGVNYGAAMTAAREMEGYDVVVVGGGNSAGQAALHLARFASTVTIVVRRPGLEETMSRYLIDEIGYNDRISVLPCTRVIDGGGEAQLEWLCLEDTSTGERTTKEARGPVPAARGGAALRLAATGAGPRQEQLRADRPRRAARPVGRRAAPGQPGHHRARASSRPATSAPAR